MLIAAIVTFLTAFVVAIFACCRRAGESDEWARKWRKEHKSDR